MKVYLSIQILSATNVSLLQNYAAPFNPEFCSMMNESIGDERFEWFVNVFLKYFNDWKEKISALPGYSPEEKKKMSISIQTMDGLKITFYSMIECTIFLLKSGMPHVLPEKFCQDILELYFGLQRACGYRCDNPLSTNLATTTMELG